MIRNGPVSIRIRRPTPPHIRSEQWWDGPSLHRHEIHADGTHRYLRNRPIQTTDGDHIDRYHPDEWLPHRDDGPAVTHPDGSTEYWIDGRRIG